MRLYPLLTPVIGLSTDLSADAHVYLLEDGLALWQAAVENAPQMHPDFMEVRGGAGHLLPTGATPDRSHF